ncbi:5209_t:CDS:2 [Entrophospora sp. SA101]|nr:5209_t:CDS:2 [Entrophospora sp. SA101]
MTESLKNSLDIRVVVSIVDDNQLTGTILKRMLRKYFKHDVSCVESGEKALNLLSKEHFNLVFMDVDMPNLTGIETTLAIRNSDTILKENVHVPVIAYTTNQWDNEYSKAGMIGYVGKPANPSKIQAELEKVSLKITTTTAITSNNSDLSSSSLTSIVD